MLDSIVIRNDSFWIRDHLVFIEEGEQSAVEP